MSTLAGCVELDRKESTQNDLLETTSSEEIWQNYLSMSGNNSNGDNYTSMIHGVSTEPLIHASNDDLKIDSIRMLAPTVFALGTCLGCLAHLASLGGSFVLSVKWGTQIEQVAPGTRLAVFVLALFISTSAVVGCCLVRHLYTIATGPRGCNSTLTDRNNFCFTTGLILGIYSSMAITKVMMDSDLLCFAVHALVAMAWTTICILVSLRRTATVVDFDDEQMDV